MKINRRLANRIMTRALSQSDQCLVGVINPDESLQCLQDYIFANCLLLRHYFFTKNFAALDAFGYRLYVQLRVNQDSLDQIHVYPHIRFRCY